MPGPLAAAGATSEPSEYATLSMDTQFTGIWTQRNPLRDADVPYLYRKFYSASRFDSIIDGINREITSRLTDARRPGSSVYNTNTFPAINSFYAFKWLLGNTQKIEVMADTASVVYDATAPNQINIWNKSAGSGKSRFLGVGNTLFFTNGVDQMKWLKSNIQWTASTQYTQGQFLIDTNGNMQALAAINNSSAIASIEVRKVQRGFVGPFSFFLIVTLTPVAPNYPVGSYVSFTGLTGYTALNGATLTIQNINPAYNLGLSTHQFAIPYGSVVYANTADTGTVTGSVVNSGQSGTLQPTWSLAVGGMTTDNQLTWTNLGSPVKPIQNSQLVIAPNVQSTASAIATEMRYWQPNTQFPQYFSILDSANNVQWVLTSGGGVTGNKQPTWNVFSGGLTSDGTLQWLNAGQITKWQASTAYSSYTAILDTNGNLQVSTGGGFTTGATQPTWNATFGASTTDGAVTWINAGPGAVLASASFSYAYSMQDIDGSVTTASPLTTIPNGVLGPAGGFSFTITALMANGLGDTNNRSPFVNIYRTAQGQATLLLLAQISNPAVAGALGSTFSYIDMLPDTSLNAFIQAPIAHSADPPPAGFTAPVLHAGRIWGIVGNLVYRSAGPDATPGVNGLTAYPPANFYQLPETCTRLKSITVSGGAGLLIFTTAHVYIILGSGTSANPFQQPQTYMESVGVLSYDEIDTVGSTLYAFTSKRKAISFDPSSGYTEVGFPVGDQFQQVTTGGISSVLYTPGNCFVTWFEKNSGDSALYVSDGAVGWFRFSPVSPPESGSLWSPRAAIVGGTSAVQSIEVTTGTPQLLIGPPVATPGPILFRDPTVNTDHETPYPSYDVKGSIGLCESGEVAEIAHIALKSTAVGARPTVSLLLDEIQAGVTVDQVTTAFDPLAITSEDPPTLDPSITMYSDRYSALQNGVCPKCENFQLKVDYGTQAFPDELLKFAVYGAKFEERNAGAVR